MTGPLYFVIPGDIDTLTGGYGYDRRILRGLREQGMAVSLVSLAGSFPFPSDADLDDAHAALTAIPDGAMVIVDGLAFGAMPAPLEAQRDRLRFIALVHHPLALETGLAAQQARALEASERRALRQASQVITTSAATARALAGYGVDAGCIAAVPPGTDPSPLAAGRQATGSHASPWQLLCVATLTPRKGHAVLLDALARIVELPWSLTCIGSDARHPVTAHALRVQREALGLGERVHFAGEVDEAQLQAAYAASDLFVLASFHEGFGMVLTEAIAYGLPIVATNGGAIAETVPEGAGLLVPPGDVASLAESLARFMTHEDTRASLRNAAHAARTTLYSWDDAVRDFTAALARA